MASARFRRARRHRGAVSLRPDRRSARPAPRRPLAPHPPPREGRSRVRHSRHDAPPRRGRDAARLALRLSPRRLRRAQAAAARAITGHARALPQAVADALCALKEAHPAFSVAMLITARAAAASCVPADLVARPGHRASPAHPAGPDGATDRRADEQGPPPLRLRRRQRALDERRHARARASSTRRTGGGTRPI